ncbi:S41 family peptidase [Aurantiacibacter luteus]|uniref:Tricorn protease homolog n=1 Tax=Aurantiacibacter luteus TaxID=1581420 RepID=A0A0G9MP97_9SPHN|nr:S41 family peptidase [Aurantiacibacter luteus]KLE32419.1 hypothetical protein AAW00_13360 [Aurantiacibacter luteus]
MIRTRLALAASTLALAFSTAAPAAAEEGFYQYPEAHDDVFVFASEGDLWRAPRTGGSAIRLTNHEEVEADPQISPDGRWLAFTASYDSPADVYVMPLAGGAPRRLTFLGGSVRTVGWTPDGQVIFAAMGEQGGQTSTLYTVAPEGGEPVAIPLWRANDATFGADGRTLFFSRRGLYDSSRDNAVLYRGGSMGELWRWTMDSNAEATRLLPDFGAQIRFPMASGGRVYFVSDKSGGDAVWSVAEDGSDARQHSAALPFPVLQASMDGGEVFLQNGADIQVYSLAANTMRPLALDIVTDREQTRNRTIANPLSLVTSARLSPSGERVAVTARGRAALGATGSRRRVELAIPLEARARETVESPDGERIFMILDQGDRGDIYAMAADGSGAPVPVTRGYDAYILSFAASPDGRTLVVWDKQARLQRVDVATGRVTLLAANDTGDYAPFRDIAFSPDGTHIAYAENTMGLGGAIANVWVQSLATGARVQGTSGRYNSYAPAFAHDGAWLYFISDRNFAPSPGHPWNERSMGVDFPDRGQVYALQLDPAAEFRFTEENELTASDDAEEEPAASGSEESEDESDGDEAETSPANIVLSGLADRLYQLPVEAGVGQFLRASEGFLYTMRGDDLVSIKIDTLDAKEEVFVADASGFDLSADGETALVVTGSPDAPVYALVPAAAKMPDDPAPNRVRLGDWRLTIDPVAEWHQMFVDAWRLHRDFAYDPAMRGVDWRGVRTSLEPLVDRIGHRAELNTILGQMASQLGILHSQVRPGDLPGDSENPEMAYLGADLSPAQGGLRIDRIYRAEADLVSRRPPLRRPGVDVREGDVIRRVDGRAVASMADLGMALASKAGQQVRLDLVRGGGNVSAIVEPMGRQGLRAAQYFDFVEGRRAATAQLSGGDVGYLHLQAMGPDDIASFARDYFAQLDRPGLIIDVRGNNGGSIDSILISQLLRQPWAFWASPDGTGRVTTNMQDAYRGHIAVLIDEGTYSDGETFAAGIKSLGIGPLVGQRTAGAGIWLGDANRLTDNGAVRIAEFAQYSLDGSWIIEGLGVAPDYPVENLPRARFEGEDAQLAAAVALLERQIAAEPVPVLRPRPLSPLGTPASDVRRLDD